MFLTTLKIAPLVVLAMGLTADAPAASSEEKPKATDSAQQANVLLDTKLLRHQSVGQELNLNEIQLDKIQAIRSAIRASHKDELAKAAEAAKKRNPLPFMRLDWKMQAEEHEALAKALPNLLKPKQMLRLRQISRQSLSRNSVRVFTAAEVVTTLQLSEEQQKKIAVIVKDTQEEMTKGVRHESSTGPVEVEAIKKAVAVGVKKVLVDVLTEEQRETWNDMLGKPFELKTKPAGRKINNK